MAEPEKLINENANPLRFDPELACYVGLNESIVLQKLYRLMQRDDWGRVVNGERWIRMSLDDWAKEMPFFDTMTIRRTLDNLIVDGLVRATTYEGRCKWYTIEIDAVRMLDTPVKRLTNRLERRQQAAQQARDKKLSVQNEQMESEVSVQNEQIESEDVSVQNEQVYLFKMNRLSVQNEQLPRILSKDPSNTFPYGKGGEPPPNRPEPKSRSPDKTVLRPESPEQLLIFEKWNQNREAQGRGPQLYFKTLQQKSKAQTAAERLGPSMLAKTLDQVLRNGAETFNHVINYIAKAAQSERGTTDGDQTHRQRDEQSGTQDIVDRLSRPGAYRL